MRIGILIITLGAALLITVLHCVAQSPVLKATDVGDFQQAAAVSIPAKINFGVNRVPVFRMLTSMHGMSALTGYVIDEADRDTYFTKIGESVGAMRGSDKGRLVVTAINPGFELRLSFESDEAKYLCSHRFVVATAGNGCVLHIMHRYTDDQPKPEDRAKLAQEQLAKGLDSFRALVPR